MQLSIIIPTYNSGKTIRKALDSIVNQDYNDWEVIIVDNLSTDRTLDIVDSYRDQRIKAYSGADKGIYDAMNKGIQFSMGEWIYFLGSDDWLFNKDVLSSIFSETPDNYDIIYGSVENANLKPEYFGAWSFDNIEYNRCHQAIFYKRSSFIHYLGGKYNTKYPLAADHEINIRWFLDSRIKTKFIPITVAHFSSGGFSDAHHDYKFDKDRDWLIMTHGYNALRKEQILLYSKRIIKNDTKILRKAMAAFVYIMCKCTS